MRTRRLRQVVNGYRKPVPRVKLKRGQWEEVIIELIAELDNLRLGQLTSEYEDAYALYRVQCHMYGTYTNKRSIEAKSVKKTRDVLHATFITLGKQIKELKRAQIVTKRSKRNVSG